jgi:hypothetical protein
MAGVLHTKVPESTNAEHRNQIACLCRRISERIESREAGAQQGSSFDRRQIVWNRHQAALLGDHHLGIATIVVYTGVFLVSAIYEIAAAAAFAVAATSAKETHTDTIADRPPLDTFAKFIDDTDGFVAGHAGPVDRKASLNGTGVRVTNTAGLDPNAREARRGVN